jgi:hypothetical protein
MTASFPENVKSFTTKVDGQGQIIYAQYLNDIYAEIVAMQTQLQRTLLLGYYANTETLTGDKTLTDADDPVQVLDPGGANRDVNLPAEAGTNHGIVFVNTADADENLVIKNDGGDTIITVHQGQVLYVIPDGSSHHVLGAGITVEEPDGTPSVSNVSKIKFSNGSVTDNGDGSVSVTSGGGSGGGRTILTADKDYYVRTDGSDSNDGSANDSSHAFLTIQKAIDTAAALDLSIYDVTIHVADGTYTITSLIDLKAAVGAGQIIIEGNTTTPSNVVFQHNVSSGASGYMFEKDQSVTNYTLKGFKAETIGPSKFVGLIGQTAGVMYLEDLYLKGCAFALLFASSSYFEINGDMTFEMVENNKNAIAMAPMGSFKTNGGPTFTLVGWNTGGWTGNTFVYVYQGNAQFYTVTFSGSSVGKPYNVIWCGVLYRSSTTIPGTTAGTDDGTGSIT